MLYRELARAELLDLEATQPLFFYNTKLIHSGKFPNYEELKSIIDAAIKRP